MQLLCALAAICCFGVAWWYKPDWSRHNAWYWLWPLVCVAGLFLAIFAILGLPPYPPGPGPGCDYHC